MNAQTAFTSRCSKRLHPEFIVEFDSSIPPADVDVLIAFLEDSVEEGTRYEAGQTIAFGSMILKAAVFDDRLTLEEPDLLAVPIS